MTSSTTTDPATVPGFFLPCLFRLSYGLQPAHHPNTDRTPAPTDHRPPATGPLSSRRAFALLRFCNHLPNTRKLDEPATRTLNKRVRVLRVMFRYPHFYPQTTRKHPQHIPRMAQPCGLQLDCALRVSCG